MSVEKDLERMLGKDSVADEESQLAAYASDQSFEQPRMPDVVAFAESTEQVQEVVRYANKTATPVVPYSSGLNLHGAAVPKQGGIILNLSRMNRIVAVDDENWFAVVEPGVTLRQLQNELRAHDLRAMLPMGVPPARSVLTSCVERDPALASASFEYGNDLLMDTEIVLPYGDLFKTGLWSAGGKPGSHMGPVRSMLYRFWTAAQGTMGILTKACVKTEHLAMVRKIFAFRFETFAEAIEPLLAIQKKEIGLECFLLNHVNFAALLCEEWQPPDRFPAGPVSSTRFEALKDDVPSWSLFVCLNGAPELPEEKIAYEQEALEEISAQMGLRACDVAQWENLLLEELLRPWGILKKFCFRGSVHDVSFKAPVKRVPEFQKILAQAAAAYQYPVDEIGAYVLPIERGRAAHCEFDFHCDPADKAACERVHKLWLDVSERLINAGAFFDRPYGAWAQMMYSRSGEYTWKLRELKKELDPNNILNPGHLCF